ncbi:MAG: DUF4380 domain-containing protein, partial [Verrucomicrobia bacterium]|nr:DUF4380 domain-containing protein [Verrucomicrobiota bacterium]
DPKTIEAELALAEQSGFNCARVFVQYLVWENDPGGLKQRMEQFLSISKKHGLRTLFVLFDDCAFGTMTEPFLGQQPAVNPGEYANGWTPSPGPRRVQDRSAWPQLEHYVKDLLGSFKSDERVLAWEIYNEPSRSLPLVEAAFRWARQAKPTQPVTTTVYGNPEMQRRILELSDVVSFHSYAKAPELEDQIIKLRASQRPILCTEWLNRPGASLVETCLPVLARQGVGAFHWGLVNGKTQTHFPWGSKAGAPEPQVWQHDIFRNDRTPYDETELAFFQKTIRQMKSNAVAAAGQWLPNKAWTWYSQRPWQVGCNFLPSTAVNDVEMWRKQTFDARTIDRELGWAQELGFNTVRVFLNFVVWREDAAGLKKRFAQFLKIADRHGIAVMPILFDDCNFAGRVAAAEKQPDPVPGVHNSQWVSSPPLTMVTNRSAWPPLEQYVKDLVGTFAQDRRIVIWDLYNEPANGMGSQSQALVEATFAWAREMKPVQPLTIGAWTDFNSPFQRRLMELSDLVSFHGYDPVPEIEAKLRICASNGRPVICTEWLVRRNGNAFEQLLPLFKARKIGCWNWGLVAGRTQTYFPWGSPQGAPQPKVWQHDILRADGSPFNAQEVQFIKVTTGKPAVSASSAATANSAAACDSSYRGWTSLALRNGLIEAQILPEIGGRIIQFKLGGKEFLWVNPQLAGKLPPATGLAADGSWFNVGGDKLWPAPQGWDNDQQWPGPPDAVLDGQPYKLEKLSAKKGETAIRLTSRKDPRSGIQFSRVVRLFDGSTRVSFEATMKNVDTKPRRWGIWAHTQLDSAKSDGSAPNALMQAWCPLNPESHFPKGYSVIFGAPDNPSFQPDPQRGLMRVQYQYQVGKLGLDSRAGWVATVDGESGAVFVQRFVFEPKKDYPDGSSVEFWHNGVGQIHAYNRDMVMATNASENPYVFESEVLSPFADLKPGQSYTWHYDWYACNIGVNFPVLNCTGAGVVAEPLMFTLVANSLQLQGRFGVFAPGFLEAIAYDEHGREVARQRLPTPVTPLMAAEVNVNLKASAAATTVTLNALGADGRPCGVLARSSINMP